jgi:curli production assembly/transport component CsgF
MASLFDKNGNIILGSYLNFDLNNDGESDLTVQVDTAPIDGNINMTIFDGISSTVLTVPYTKN